MIRFGVIGTNWITDKWIEAASHHKDFQLTAVYSRTKERAQLFAERHGAENVFTCLHEMADSHVLDAVYIASPNAFHAEQAILLMKGNKHVLCEKPFASNVHEVEEMRKTALKHNVLLMEAVKSTLMPSFLALNHHIHKIGKVRRFMASFCKYSSRYDAYRKGTVLNAFKPELSNGSLMDLGIYCIYPLVALFGEPQSVQASAVMLESGVDGCGSVLLQYDDFEAVLMHSKITDSHIHSEIQGEDGTIIIDEISEPNKIQIRYRKSEVENVSIQTDFPPMYYETAEFIQLIQSGKIESTKNSFEYSLITAKITEKARKQIGLTFPADKRQSKP